MSQLTFESLLRQDYLTVSELTRRIKSLLEESFPPLWVQGEISNLRNPASGHLYFSLKDEQAQIPCVMWRSRNEWLPFVPEDGMKVVVNARMSLYEKRGAYQLDVWQMIPSGAGELQMAFEQLKARLRAEGLFAPEHKRPLPKFPRRIGIVTSSTGAAIRDLISVLWRRFPLVEIILNPVRVQGEGAAAEIARAIGEFNQYGEVDVLIVGRGGGSLEDLWAFNEERVARAVFNSHIPVVSAVGHEIDFSICDFVADLRAPTPSAAAELVVPSQDDIRITLAETKRKLTLAVVEQIRHNRDKIATIQRGYAFRQPMDRVRQQTQRLDELKRNVVTVMRHQVALHQQRLKGYRDRLSLLEHRNILKRGYSLCFRRSDGKLVNTSSDLKSGAEIELEFFVGKAQGTVSKTIDGES